MLESVIVFFSYLRIFQDKSLYFDRVVHWSSSHEGQPMCSANAYLAEQLQVKNPFSQYSKAHGSGSGSSKFQAISKAISEALERWAFVKSTDLKSTCGMAAHPLKKAAIRNAKQEAFERWCLSELNEGRLPLGKFQNNFLGDIYYFNLSPTMIFTLVTTLVDGKRYYGFSVRPDLEKSFKHSLIEMNRTIKSFSTDKNESSKNLYEERIKYFSLENGQEKFKSLIEKALEYKNSALNLPSYQIKSLKGEWSKFAHVIHCRIENHEDLNTDLDYFLF